MSTPYERILFLGDSQIPDQDDPALKVARDFHRDFKPHKTVHVGDLLNVDQVSDYPNDCGVSLEDEFELGRNLLRDFKVTHFLLGNHEQRLQRPGLVKPTLRKTFDPVRNLHLSEMGIKWKPYHKTEGIFTFGKLNVIHGYFIGQHAAMQHALAYNCVLFGHTHRVQSFQPKHAFTQHTGYNIGCTCKLDLVYRQNQPPDGWCQGFAFGYFFRSGMFSLYQVKLIGDEFAIEGKVYRR